MGIMEKKVGNSVHGTPSLRNVRRSNEAGRATMERLFHDGGGKVSSLATSVPAGKS
jgi:hypothetical protein